MKNGHGLIHNNFLHKTSQLLTSYSRRPPPPPPPPPTTKSNRRAGRASKYYLRKMVPFFALWPCKLWESENGRFFSNNGSYSYCSKWKLCILKVEPKSLWNFPSCTSYQHLKATIMGKSFKRPVLISSRLPNRPLFLIWEIILKLQIAPSSARDLTSRN